jgi:hypothetical protein
MKVVAALIVLLTLGIPWGWAQSTTGTAPSPIPAQTAAGAVPGSTTAPAATPPPGAPAAAGAPAQTQTKPDLSLPVDASKNWVVGFTVFSAEGLSPENTYLAYSLPLMLKNDVSALTTHTYAGEERLLKRKVLITAQLALSDQAITKVQKDRDALLFGATPPTDKDIQAAGDRMTAALARKQFLQSLDPSSVDVAETKPITLMAGKGVGDLLDLPQVPPDIYCARQGIDFLIGGRLSEVQGYLLLDLWAYDATRQKMVLSSREAAGRDEFYTSLSSVGKELVGEILGRDWAVIAFKPDPPDAALFLDGTLTASGVSPRLYLTPGEHLVRVSSTGYRDDTRTLVLEPEQQASLAVTLEKEQRGSVTIATDPPGADLYVDSIWQGKTPIAVPLPPERSRGVLSLTGYYDLSFPVDVSAPPLLSLSLQKDIGSRDAMQKKARDQFYVSFGWFAVSIPIPLLSYAFYIDSLVQQLDLSIIPGMETQSAAAQGRANAFLLGYYSGLAVSGALLTWMVIQIVHYITVANWTAG